MSATVHGGPFDGEVIEREITVLSVPMAHIVDDKLAGVAWHDYDREANVLRFRTYEPSV